MYVYIYLRIYAADITIAVTVVTISGDCLIYHNNNVEIEAYVAKGLGVAAFYIVNPCDVANMAYCSWFLCIWSARFWENLSSISGVVLIWSQ
jgi:hypothetical protein